MNKYSFIKKKKKKDFWQRKWHERFKTGRQPGRGRESRENMRKGEVRRKPRAGRHIKNFELYPIGKGKSSEEVLLFMTK